MPPGMDDMAVSTARIYTDPSVGTDGSAEAADEAPPGSDRIWAYIRPRQIEGGTWVYPVRYARPEVTRYDEIGGTHHDLVTPDVLSDPAWTLSVPGTPVILGGGDLHRRVVDMTDEQIRARRAGVALSSWWDGASQAHVGEIAVDDPDAVEAIQSGRVREVSIAYRVERRPATPDEHAEHGATRVQTRRHSPRNVALVARGRASTTIVADEATIERRIPMDRDLAAVLVEHGLESIEERKALEPLLREVVTLRAAAQVAADAAEAEAEADAEGAPGTTYADWSVLVRLRDAMGIDGDAEGTYAEAAAATLAAMDIEVPEGADPAMLRSLVGMASRMAAKMAAPEPEADMGGYEDPAEDVAADSAPNTITGGIGRRVTGRARNADPVATLNRIRFGG